MPEYNFDEFTRDPEDITYDGSEKNKPASTASPEPSYDTVDSVENFCNGRICGRAFLI